jgi:hypothetical protein
VGGELSGGGWNKRSHFLLALDAVQTNISTDQ